MTRAFKTVFEALTGVRRAIYAGLHGNAFYLALQQITELSEIIGREDRRSYSNANGQQEPRLQHSLEVLRKAMEAEIFDNRFYIATHKLDVLSFLSSRIALKTEMTENSGAPNPHGAMAMRPATSAAAERSFDELASASAARVRTSAASLGILPRQGAGASVIAPPASQAETLADGELERRSSGSLHTRETPKHDMGALAAPAFFPRSIPGKEEAGAPPEMGSSRAFSSDNILRSYESRFPPKTEASQKAASPSASAHDSKAASARQTLDGHGEMLPPRPIYSWWFNAAERRRG